MPESRSRSKQRRRSYLPPPTKKKRRPSPRWFGFLILGLMIVGVGVIVLNYMGLMPFSGGQTEGLYLWSGLGLIAFGFLAATQWR